MKTKEIQGKLWSIAPQKWSVHFEPYFTPMYKKALGLIKPGAYTTLLDAGCGSGLFTQLAVRSTASVTGVDAAGGLLDVARRRNPGISFLEEDLESLPFSNSAFDVVTGFNSFQYAGNVPDAITEAARVLVTGGRLVLGIWDKPEHSEASNILKAVGSLLPPPPPGTPGPFALSEDGVLEGMMKKAGLSPVVNEQVDCPFLYHSLSDAVDSFMGTGPAAAAMNHHSQEKVRDTIAEAFRPYRLTEDLYHLQNRFLLFVAEKK